MATGKYKKYEGSRDVNGTETPISRESIRAVTADNWSEASIGELMEQRSILYSRLSTAQQYCPGMVPAIRRGINQIDTIMNSKENNDMGLM